MAYKIIKCDLIRGGGGGGRRRQESLLDWECDFEQINLDFILTKWQNFQMVYSQ